jgi:hypothetical protein
MNCRLPIANCGLSAAVALLACATLVGCVEQTMTIDSSPSGALVTLNDQEIGRTPFTRDFKWYGDYDVQVRLEGYQTLKTHQKVSAPVWNWVPLDLFAALAPLHFADHKSLTFALKPIDPAGDDLQGLVDRAQELKDAIESSAFTRVPTPRAATRATTTRPATTRPATMPSK